MKPPLAHVSQTALAALAAGIAIWLSVFVLPGAGGQAQPIPLLPAIGGAAGEVAKAFETPSRHVATRRPAATRANRATLIAKPRHVAAPRPVVHRTQRAHAPAVRASLAPRRAAVTAPVTSRGFSASRGKAKARGHSHAAGPPAWAGARGRGHEKARGHSTEHHRGLPPGQAKKAQALLAPSPNANGQGARDHGGGNGHGGGKR
jgi:hypothetical protein